MKKYTDSDKSPSDTTLEKRIITDQIDLGEYTAMEEQGVYIPRRSLTKYG